MADVTREEIKHIADLAMLNLTDKEIDDYTKNMQDILQYAEMINNVDISNIDEAIGISNQVNVFRKDEIKEFKSREALLQNAPSQDEGMFRIPSVIK